MPDDVVEEEGEKSLEEELSEGEIASAPTDVGDPPSVVAEMIPAEIFAKYEVFSYRNAASILRTTRTAEFSELIQALTGFSMTRRMIRIAGGNESDIPKVFSDALRPRGWHETVIQGDLLITKSWREEVTPMGKRGKPLKPRMETQRVHINRLKYLDGHKIDYVKDRVAFDLEWNSKDQTFDRDLYAFSAFFQSGVIDAGVLVTRSAELNPVFRTFGQALNKDGSLSFTKTGTPRPTYSKYGPSTTFMGKLLYRLNAGRNGGCPVLALGIKPACISDLNQQASTQ